VLGAGIGISGNCGAAALSNEGGHHGGGYHSMASSTEGAEAAKPAKTTIASSHGTDMVSAGNAGIANGTQVHAPIQVPVNVAGNGVGVLGVGVGVNGSSTAVAAQH
jgi:hypothetical protein